MKKGFTKKAHMKGRERGEAGQKSLTIIMVKH